MIGNAVPVNLAKYLAENIKKQLNENECKNLVEITNKQAITA